MDVPDDSLERVQYIQDDAKREPSVKRREPSVSQQQPGRAQRSRSVSAISHPKGEPTDPYDNEDEETLSQTTQAIPVYLEQPRTQRSAVVDTSPPPPTILRRPTTTVRYEESPWSGKEGDNTKTHELLQEMVAWNRRLFCWTFLTSLFLISAAVFVTLLSYEGYEVIKSAEPYLIDTLVEVQIRVDQFAEHSNDTYAALDHFHAVLVQARNFLLTATDTLQGGFAKLFVTWPTMPQISE